MNNLSYMFDIFVLKIETIFILGNNKLFICFCLITNDRNIFKFVMQ